MAKPIPENNSVLSLYLLSFLISVIYLFIHSSILRTIHERRNFAERIAAGDCFLNSLFLRGVPVRPQRGEEQRTQPPGESLESPRGM